jgi:hypothetical protein
MGAAARQLGKFDAARRIVTVAQGLLGIEGDTRVS